MFGSSADTEAWRLRLSRPQEVPAPSNREVDASHHRHIYGNDHIGVMEVAQGGREGMISKPTLGAAL